MSDDPRSKSERPTAIQGRAALAEFAAHTCEEIEQMPSREVQDILDDAGIDRRRLQDRMRALLAGVERGAADSPDHASNLAAAEQKVVPARSLFARPFATALEEARRRLEPLQLQLSRDPVGALSIALHIPAGASVGALARSNAPQRAAQPAQPGVLGGDGTLTPGAESLAGDAARDLLKSADCFRAPVDLDRVAEHLGLLVTREACDTLLNLEGCFVTDGRVGGVLLNTAATGSRRRRFTYGHEIGHAALHRSVGIGAFGDSRAELDQFHGGMESEANSFASRLLMPSALLHPHISPATRPRISHVSAVADAFRVSHPAAMYRIVRESELPCVLIAYVHGRVKWSVASQAFTGRIQHGAPAPRGTVAAEYIAATGNRRAGHLKEALEPSLWLPEGTAFSSVDESSYKADDQRVFSILAFR